MLTWQFSMENQLSTSPYPRNFNWSLCFAVVSYLTHPTWIHMDIGIWPTVVYKNSQWIWAAISRHLQSYKLSGFPVTLEAGAFQYGRLSDMLSPKVMKPLQPRGWRWFMVNVSIVNGFIIIVSLTYIENIRKQLIMICTMLGYNDVGGILTWLSWFLLFTLV